ncbi:unnamed protein product [Auanema sp. JU1783]|nr:unnamed protein product [Auanema sp. JU1783]
MFYSQFVLSKKGPLAKIWLAAHWEKKLSKAQIYETNVEDAVEEILKPKVKMALRTTGHLLLGIVRIYSRKTKYLLADCNEAFLKIKMAFRPGQVELSDDVRDNNTSLQGIPDVYTDFDTALPEFNDAEFANHLQVSQSRIDDITLKEDLIGDPSNMRFNDDFGMDDFGESSVGMGSGFDDDFGAFDRSSAIEVGRDASASAFGNSIRDIREPTPSLEGKMAPGAPIFNTDDDFVGGDMGDDDMDGNVFNDNMSAVGNMEAPGSDLGDEMQLGATANSLQGDRQESFALEPLDVSALDKMQEKRRRKRRLIVDDQKNISGEEMKNNMLDYSDTLQTLDLAPPTRKLMRMKEAGTVEKLFHMPGFQYMKAKPLIRLYQSHLVLKARVDDVLKPDDIRKELDLSDIIEDDFQYQADCGEDFEDIGPVNIEPLTADSPPPMAELDAEESPVKDLEDSPTSEKRKRKSNLNETTRTEDDEAAEGDEDHRWTKRTQGVLNSISTKLNSSACAEVSFDFSTLPKCVTLSSNCLRRNVSTEMDSSPVELIYIIQKRRGQSNFVGFFGVM